MIVTVYQTKKIVEGDDLSSILDNSLPKDLPENSVIAVSSKIIAICEGQVADPEKESRDDLAKKEAEYYLPRETNPYDVMITIKNNTLIASAGIDASNGNGKYVLWPKDVQQSANIIRELLVQQYSLTKSESLRPFSKVRGKQAQAKKSSLSEVLSLSKDESKGIKRKHIGVIVTDSRLSPLRWGVTGVALSHSGFVAVNSYIGKEDVFGRKLQVETVNVADTLAAAAVGVMGEGAEQTPLAVVSDIPWVRFVDHNPTKEELDMLHIDMNKEVFTPILTAVKWEKGESQF